MSHFLHTFVQVSEADFVASLVHGVVPLSGLTWSQVESMVLELMTRRIRCGEV